ncbi:MAG: hypothetical protein R3204_13800, partial [Oceanospirillum sp.]|nr:hypothetical protein [Oceanospirillum sp.]
MKKLNLLAIALPLLISGCGDTSSGEDSNNIASDSENTSSSEDTNNANKVISRFIDSAVEGVYYKASSGSEGFTDSKG